MHQSKVYWQFEQAHLGVYWVELLMLLELIFPVETECRGAVVRRFSAVQKATKNQYPCCRLGRQDDIGRLGRGEDQVGWALRAP